jgi:hypothetical protein
MNAAAAILSQSNSPLRLWSRVFGPRANLAARKSNSEKAPYPTTMAFFFSDVKLPSRPRRGRGRHHPQLFSWLFFQTSSPPHPPPFPTFRLLLRPLRARRRARAAPLLRNHPPPPPLAALQAVHAQMCDGACWRTICKKKTLSFDLSGLARTPPSPLKVHLRAPATAWGRIMSIFSTRPLTSAGRFFDVLSHLSPSAGQRLISKVSASCPPPPSIFSPPPPAQVAFPRGQPSWRSATSPRWRGDLTNRTLEAGYLKRALF